MLFQKLNKEDQSIVLAAARLSFEDAGYYDSLMNDLDYDDIQIDNVAQELKKLSDWPREELSFSFVEEFHPYLIEAASAALEDEDMIATLTHELNLTDEKVHQFKGILAAETEACSQRKASAASPR